MFHASAHRSANWLALLATAFFVGWPSLVHGNCCCETQQRVKLTVPVDVAPSCCQTKTSCDSRTNSERLRSCCSGLNDDAAGCTADSNDAGCGVSCCRTVASIALRSAPPNQVRAASLLIVDAQIEFPDGVEIPSSNLPQLPVHFLRAQDHCAQICRWRK